MVDEKVTKFLAELTKELVSVTERYSRFNSFHEGHAAIGRKLDELLDMLKEISYIRPGHRAERLRRKATQVAAMAMRFAIQYGE